MTSPRGIRNRNPGNIVVSGWTQRQDGYSGPEPEGRFATFRSMADGLAALIRLLVVYRKQHELTTVRGIIDRWAPPTENDTSAYVLAVSKALGVRPDDELPDHPSTYRRLALAIARHENGPPADASITTQDYIDALAAVFPTAPAEPPAIEEKTHIEPAADWPFKHPSKESKTMIPVPILTAAASTLFPIIADLFKSRGSKTAERNAAIIEAAGPTIVDIAKAVTGQPTAEQAVTAIQTDPAVQQQFREAVAADMDRLVGIVERLAKVEEESRGKAREFADQMTNGPMWRAVGFGSLVAALALIIVVGGGYMMWHIITDPGTTGEQRGMLIGALVSFVATVVAYFFGSSVGSKQSGDAIREIAKGKQ